jgi:hypothetical protein
MNEQFLGLSMYRSYPQTRGLWTRPIKKISLCVSNNKVFVVGNGIIVLLSQMQILAIYRIGDSYTNMLSYGNHI